MLLAEALPLRYNERKHSQKPVSAIRAGNQDLKKKKNTGTESFMSADGQ